jgi:peptidyl-prolyl cis-trans isomerase C
MQAKCRTWFWALVTGLALVSIALPTLAGKKQVTEDKVALVNGSVIPRKDLDREVNRVQQELASMGRPASDAQLSAIKKEMLENLISLELLYQASQKKGIKVEEAAIDEKWGGLKKRFPGEAEFKNMLSKLNLSEADVRSHLRRGVAVEQFVDQEFYQKATVSEKEIKDYYDTHPDRFKKPEQVQASHILIEIDPQASAAQKAEAHKKLEKIQKKVGKGEDFAALAKEHSQCPSSAEGGNLGYFQRGQMVKPFEEAAFALEPGKVSDIVETRFGYHLIKVTDKKPETTLAYKNVKDGLEEHLKEDKVRQEVRTYVEKLKEEAKVERFLPEDPAETSSRK